MSIGFVIIWNRIWKKPHTN